MIYATCPKCGKENLYLASFKTVCCKNCRIPFEVDTC